MTDRPDPWTLEHAIEIARIGAGKSGYRVYPGGGGMWCGSNDGFADANFNDWGLAKATATILNAVINGKLVLAGDGEAPNKEG